MFFDADVYCALMQAYVRLDATVTRSSVTGLRSDSSAVADFTGKGCVTYTIAVERLKETTANISNQNFTNNF